MKGSFFEATIDRPRVPASIHTLSRSQLKPPEHSAVGTGTGFSRCMARYKDGQRAKITIGDITCISRVTYEKCTKHHM
jgi:hypothetical protein